MLSDFHLHTDFSADSRTPVNAQIRRAVSLGMSRICITDHQDFDYPEQYQEDFTFSTESYLEHLRAARNRYDGQIRIFAGVELGLRTHLKQQLSEYAAAWPFDYIIGSIHLVGDVDPYYPAFFQGRTVEDAYREYFTCTLENIRLHHNCFDALGHLDYVLRYGPEQERFDAYACFQDIIDEILRLLVAHGKALECNTAGLRFGLGHTNPHPDIVRRFVELGGEMVTIGSDAHTPDSLGYGFDMLKTMLEACGLHYYTEFHGRKPQFYSL